MEIRRFPPYARGKYRVDTFLLIWVLQKLQINNYLNGLPEYLVFWVFNFLLPLYFKIMCIALSVLVLIWIINFLNVKKLLSLFCNTKIMSVNVPLSSSNVHLVLPPIQGNVCDQSMCINSLAFSSSSEKYLCCLLFSSAVL